MAVMYPPYIPRGANIGIEAVIFLLAIVIFGFWWNVRLMKENEY